MPIIGYTRIVDCSHPVSESMPLWPGDPATRFTPCAALGDDGYALRFFSMSEHAGTHCNAPNTFFSHGADIAKVFQTPLVVPMVVADFSGRAAKDDSAIFTPAHLALWETAHGTVPSGCLFCLYTGWDAKWATPEQFLGYADAKSMRFPAFAPETATILMKERRVRGVGIDTLGVDSPLESSYLVNRTILESGGIVLECLTRLGELPPAGNIAVVGGLRLSGGTGCPVSVLAFVE